MGISKATAGAVAPGAKGDLVVGSATNDAAVLAVGSNGDTLVADSAATTGLRWQGNFAAGKNKIINGDFSIWQRGTSFTAASGTYTVDRFLPLFNGSGSARTVSQQSFTAGTAPVAGYESTFFVRYNQTTAGTGATFNNFIQRIEDVRTFAGQTVTISFWAKAATAGTYGVGIAQNFGTGGSTQVAQEFTSEFNVTTSWARYSKTVTLASISGKTIGTNSSLIAYATMPLNATFTLDIWGFQVEAGDVATAFQTATGTIQGELEAAQRYYFEIADGTQAVGFGSRFNATTLYYSVPVAATMRTTPTVTYSGTVYYQGGGGGANTGTLSSPSATLNRTNFVVVQATTSGTPLSGEAYIIEAGKHTFSAEL